MSVRLLRLTDLTAAQEPSGIPGYRRPGTMFGPSLPTPARPSRSCRRRRWAATLVRRRAAWSGPVRDATYAGAGPGHRGTVDQKSLKSPKRVTTSSAAVSTAYKTAVRSPCDHVPAGTWRATRSSRRRISLRVGSIHRSLSSASRAGRRGRPFRHRTGGMPRRSAVRCPSGSPGGRSSTMSGSTRPQWLWP
jgi:hypothetical protein